MAARKRAQNASSMSKGLRPPFVGYELISSSSSSVIFFASGYEGKGIYRQVVILEPSATARMHFTQHDLLITRLFGCRAFSIRHHALRTTNQSGADHG
jgi:hypothetical protein